MADSMMDRPQDWHRVASILEAALELPPGARAAFVRDACAGDHDLLEEIGSLLIAHAEAGGFLEGVPLGDTTAATVPVAPPGAGTRFTSGQRVGRYRVERLLGRGGMGEVYAAEDVEYGRRVALKVIRGGLTTPQERERFLREGQLAAAVNHPNSVYIFGSDIVDRHPVIVMELLGGGTLKDRVRVEGPLRPAVAVDAILQVIAGLEAAYAGGILHRDIKPSNCFVDRDGTVKIGDFGLSLSTTADLQGTITAALRMTPQFAAPERLKGAAPDVRAEIYGVGATLFYLLIGEPPFDTRDLLALLTRVMTEPPRSPGAVVAGVPRGLSEVVLRCLAKQPEDRFGSYASLREALVPFGSSTPPTAGAGVRFAAMVVDQVHITVLNMAINAIAIVVSVRLPGANVARAALMAAYFIATEAFAGGSPGKLLFGLRVVDRDSGKPRVGAVVLRTAVYVCVAQLPFVVPFDVWVRLFAADPSLLPVTTYVEVISRLITIINLVGLFAPLLLFVTARPRHGFTGVHELLSGTRVCRVTPVTARRSSPSARTEVPAQRPLLATIRREMMGHRGSFVLREEWSKSDGRRVWLAFDPVLRRDVFVVDHGAGASIAPAERRDLARPGRLRWLAGQAGSPTWEAFDAPAGTPLPRLATTPRPWSDVRCWLLDLVRELAACEETGEPVALTTDHVWIARDGRAVLLDFPAPRTWLASDDADGTQSTAPAQRLLWNVAVTALTGRPPLPTAAASIHPPLPASGTALVQALAGPVPISARELLPLCQRAADGETNVPRLSRVWPAAALMFTVVMLMLVAMMTRGLTGQLMFPGMSSDENALVAGLVKVDTLDRAGIATADPQRRALEIFLVRAFALRERAATMGGVLRPYRTLAADIGRRHPSPSPGELEIAVDVLGQLQLDAMSRAAPLPSTAFGGLLFLLLALTEIVLPAFTVIGLVAVVLAVALRGGLLWTLLHLVVVDEAGTRVGRGRALFRVLVAWAPVFALFAMRESVFRAVMAGDIDVWVIAALLLTAAIALATVWGAVMPSRGLQERLSRTWIVPA